MKNIIEINDFSAPELDIYARTSEVQLLRYNEPVPGFFIAESPKVIERACSAGYEPFSFLVEHKDLEGEAKELLERFPEIPVYTAEYEILVKLTGYALTRGLLCVMKRRTLPTVEEICQNTRRIAILENVVNPTNIGEDGMKTLRKLGFKTVAMALQDDSFSIDDPQLHAQEKLAIILGTEGDGLAAETIADCDYTVKIPMSHGVDSLNVAAASAVAFWELGRK